MAIANDFSFTAGTHVSMEVVARGEKIVLSSIVEAVTDNILSIQIPTYKGTQLLFSRTESFLLRVVIGEEMFAQPAFFLGTEECDKFELAQIRVEGRLKPHQQRECYRLPISLEVLLERGLMQDSSNAKQDQIECRTINISDGGMLIAIDEKFDRNDTINVIFTAGIKERVNAKVLRCSVVDNDVYRFEMAIQFTFQDKNQKRRLYKYIVDEQLAQRRKWNSM